MAAVLVADGAVLSHRSAAALWVLRRSDRTAVEITVPRALRPRARLEIHEGRLPPDEVTTHDGILVTTPARILLDLAAVVSPQHLERAATEAEIHRLGSPTSLAALVGRYPTRTGTKTIRRLLNARDIGRNITKHQLELRFLAFLDAHRLPRPRINATVDVPPEPREVDCLWPDHRLIAELDGFAAHGTRTAFEEDRDRDRALLVARYRVTRITWRQIAEDEDALADALRSLLDPRTRPGPLALTTSMISTNQFKNGNHIEVDGTVFKILEFQHVKPGKGGAFVRSKLRRASDGNVIDRTFRAGEKFRAVRTEARKMQFLYADGSDAHFMDTESYEQMAIPESTVADALKWTKPNETVDVLFIDGSPSDLQLPASVELEVTQTDPGLRGDTASGGGNKPATLETGATINVPLFVDVGQRVKVDTRSGEYMSRA